jgi:hypothetical protein
MAWCIITDQKSCPDPYVNQVSSENGAAFLGSAPLSMLAPGHLETRLRGFEVKHKNSQCLVSGSVRWSCRCAEAQARCGCAPGLHFGPDDKRTGVCVGVGVRGTPPALAE